MTHTTSALTGAAAGLLLTGALYWKTKPSAFAARTPSIGSISPPRPAAPALGSTDTLDRVVEEARSVEEIVEALRRVLEGPPDRAATWQAHSLLARLRPEQYLDCLRLAEKRLGEVAHESFLRLLGSVWAEENPEATVRALFASDQGKDTGSTGGDPLNSDRVRVGIGMSGPVWSRVSPLSVAFEKWIDRDQDTAIRWLRDHHARFPISLSIDNNNDWSISGPPRNLAQELANKVIERARREGLTSSLQCLSQMPASFLSHRTLDLWQRELALAEPSEKMAALDMARQWSEREHDPLLARAMGEAMTEELTAWRDDPQLEAGLRFQAGLSLVAATHQNSYEKNGMTNEMVSQSQRLERAQQLATTLGPLSETQLISLVRAWWVLPDHGEGQEAMLAWVRDQPGADAALASGARQVADIHRTRALQWAEAIGDPSQRDLLLRGLYRQWLDEEPARAQEELSRLGLSEETVASLQTIQP